MLERYADPEDYGAGAQTMLLEELIGYLGQTNDVANTPLAAALALTDPGFFVAGEHSLHLILDHMQLGAVGRRWRTRSRPR